MAKGKRKLKVFEAFAGIGAQSVALRRAKIPFVSVGISEWFIDAIISYDALNHGNEELPKVPSYKYQLKYLSKFTFSIDSQKPIKNLKSIGKEKIRQLYIANKRSKNYGSITEINPDKLPKIDLLTYSFPCQDLSTGGKTLGMAKGSGTRSGLLWEIERLLKGLSTKKHGLPKYLLLENVAAIIADSNKDDLDEWLSFLRSLGYKNSDPVILDASEFGVPQDRKRCIIVSSLKKKYEIDGNLKRSSKPNALNFYFDDYKNPILKKEADDASLNPTISRLNMWRINHRDPVSSSTIFHTVTCNMDRSNNAGMVRYDLYKGRWFRLLTIREAFRLMGFTQKQYETIKELGFSYRRMNKLIGNSIVVNVLAAVFSEVFKEYKQ
jgi:DNA (cytosine-5)-methyltransferase 1